jgi:hypothetical protein
MPLTHLATAIDCPAPDIADVGGAMDSNPAWRRGIRHECAYFGLVRCAAAAGDHFPVVPFFEVKMKCLSIAEGHACDRLSVGKGFIASDQNIELRGIVVLGNPQANTTGAGSDRSSVNMCR